MVTSKEVESDLYAFSSQFLSILHIHMHHIYMLDFLFFIRNFACLFARAPFSTNSQIHHNFSIQSSPTQVFYPRRFSFVVKRYGASIYLYAAWCAYGVLLFPCKYFDLFYIFHFSHILISFSFSSLFCYLTNSNCS